MTDWSQRTVASMASVRETSPMIHHITNDVVTNFTANATLALGAAPVMAPCADEVEQMVSMAGALLLNIGTLNPAQVDSMLAAGHKAGELGIPIVLDPVGAGATSLRTEAAQRLLDELKVTVVRGNAGEVLTLCGAGGKVRGVDSQEGLGQRHAIIDTFAEQRGLVVAVTGEVDRVSDGARSLAVHNGHPLMGRVTGTGCAATTAVACFVAANKDEIFEATVSALAAFGLAGELGAERAHGPGTFVPHFIDALAGLDSTVLGRGLRIEEA